MIDRRNFLNVLSGSAVLAAVPTVSRKTPELTSSRGRISLNGEWNYYVEGKSLGKVTVPSSQRPSGFYDLNRSFILPRMAHVDRAFIHFEGITYWGQVSINGQKLGYMNPYVPHEFEFTPVAKEGENQIEVSIADLVPFPDGNARPQIEFGIHPGFEAYGGIIRDVWVEVRPSAFIENVRLAYELKNNYRSCEVRPQIIVSSARALNADLQIVLHRNESHVAIHRVTKRLAEGVTKIDLNFDLEDVALWSPESPNLYQLTAQVKTESSDDSWTCRTGFREIRTEGRIFKLNGKRLILNGVCRHDMWKDQGFTLSRQQQELDMRMITALGCNFARLVHYPHDRHIVELADELGLLVSEEPGFWQADFQRMDRTAIEVGYKILEATIRRDWNSPSVMIWFLSNECTLTEEFLREGKRRCNNLDPIRRLVSAANDKPADKVKPLFVAADMDFFDQHEYTFQLNEMDDEAKYDGPSKPLIFSEWGGKSIGQAQPIMGQSVDRLTNLVESGLLSGHMFWSWQDIRQYSRVDGEVRDGVLETGAVTEARDIREPVWSELARLFTGGKKDKDSEQEDAGRLTMLPLRWNLFNSGSTFHNVDLQPLVDASSGKQSWASLQATIDKYWKDRFGEDQGKQTGSNFGFWNRRELKIGGVSFLSPTVSGRVQPLVLTPELSNIEIPIHQSCSQLHILGQVSFPLGYPLVGQASETAAVYTLQYASGKKQALPIRHGIEVAQANCVAGASRIAPIATAAQPAVEYMKDPAREQYQIRLWSVSVEPGELVSLQCRLNPSQPAIAIFAITLEQPERY